MRKKAGLLILAVSLILVLAGAGLVYGQKIKKLAQSSNSNPAASSDISFLSDPTVTKNVYSSSTRSSDSFLPGESFNIDLSFPGRPDTKAGGKKPAEVMLVIDMSTSMSHKLNNYNCVLRNPITNKVISSMADTRLCFAKKAAVNFIEEASQKNLDIRIGFQLFSGWGPTYHNNFFSELKDISKTEEKNELINRLVGEDCKDGGSGCQYSNGTAQGLGIWKASRELAEKGRANVDRYIILLGDGAAKVPPSTAGCNGHQEYGGAHDLADSWPEDWPNINPDSPCNQPAPSGVTDHWVEPCFFDSYAKDENLNTPLPIEAINTAFPYRYMITANSQYSQSHDVYKWSGMTALLAECTSNNVPENQCVTCAKLGFEGASSPVVASNPLTGPLGGAVGGFVGKGLFENSPVDYAKKNNIKAFSIGYYVGSSETHPRMLKMVTSYLYKKAEPGEDPPGYYDDSGDPNELNDIFKHILKRVSGQDSKALIHLEEKLPPGVTVSPTDVIVKRGNITLSPAELTPGADGRITVSVDITLNDYGENAKPENQTFKVLIRNIKPGSATCFDADQNSDANFNPLPNAEKPSKVIWSFPLSGGADKIAYMIPWKMCPTTQYSGDIYGKGISNYAFPGIDVAVSGGVNNADKSIWNLDHYNFSATSYSNYDKFLTEMTKIQTSLKKRALTGLDIYSAITRNQHRDIYPEGEVYIVDGSPTLDRAAKIGNGNRTIIITGGLTINADINKNSNSHDNLFLLVNGNVTISNGVKSVQAAIVAPGSDPQGQITIADGISPIKIFGLLVGREVNLRNVGALYQQIHYDPNLALYPPPGLSQIGLPIFKEVKP